MKLKNEFIIKEILDKCMAVGIANSDDDFNGVISLNETGKRIFELIQEGKDEDSIVNAMLEEYDTTEDIVRTEVVGVINKLEQEGILEK